MRTTTRLLPSFGNIRQSINTFRTRLIPSLVNPHGLPPTLGAYFIWLQMVRVRQARRCANIGRE